MANKVLTDEQDGTPKQMCFADHGADFAGGAAGTSLEFGTPTDVQWDSTDLADGAARQSAKCDLGVLRAPAYKVRAAFEFAVAPVSLVVVELYWAPSSSSTAANGNAGGVSGSDATYTGTAGDSLADSVPQLDYIGVFSCTADATGTVQVAEVGVFSPTARYGSLVVKNEAGQAFHSDAVESHVVFDPIYDEIQ